MRGNPVRLFGRRLRRSSWLPSASTLWMCRRGCRRRVRLLGSTKANKNDSNDALSTAIAGYSNAR
jgi:hypothetical protein